MAGIPRRQPLLQPAPNAAGNPDHRATAPAGAQQPSQIPGLRKYLDMAQAARDGSGGWKIERPNLAESFIPVFGPLWEAAADVQEGNYGSAAFNGLMAVADASPFALAGKGALLVRAINKTRRAPLLARAPTATARIRKLKNLDKDWEVHHVIPMKGLGPIPRADRQAEGLWRNHPVLLKPLPTKTHRRLTGSWQGEPQFGPVMRAWHGTNALQKSGAAFMAGRAADGFENIARPFGPPRASGPKR